MNESLDFCLFGNQIIVNFFCIYIHVCTIHVVCKSHIVASDLCLLHHDYVPVHVQK